MFNIRFSKFKRSSARRGFTLVEVIVTLVITLIIIGVSGSIIISTTNIFGKTAMRDIQQNIAETVLSFATDRMLYASEIEAVDSLSGIDLGGKAVVGIVDGQLFFKRAEDPSNVPVNIFGSNFYRNYTVALKYSIVSDAVGNQSVSMSINITDKRNGNLVLERLMTRPLLNYAGGDVSDVMVGGTGNKVYIIISE